VQLAVVMSYQIDQPEAVIDRGLRTYLVYLLITFFFFSVHRVDHDGKLRVGLCAVCKLAAVVSSTNHQPEHLRSGCCEAVVCHK